MRFLSATNPAQKKRNKVEHGFKVTSDGRLIIRDEDDAGDKGEHVFPEHVGAGNNTFVLTDDGEMKDILEEAGVKSVSTSAALVWLMMHGCSCFHLSRNCQKKTQKRKFQEGNFDEDMDTDTQLKYKGMFEHAEIDSVAFVG